MKTSYSTSEVAREAGVHKLTLLRWLYSGAIPEPKRVRKYGQDHRVFAPADLRRVLAHKAKTFRKGRGRKKKVPVAVLIVPAESEI